MASWPVAPNARPFPPQIPAAVAQAAANGGLPQALIDQLSHWFAAARDMRTGYVPLAERTATLVVPPAPGRLALAIALAAGATVYIGHDDSVAVPPTNSGTPGFLSPALLVFGPENPLAVYAVSQSATSLTWLALFE